MTCWEWGRDGVGREGGPRKIRAGKLGGPR